MIHHFSLEDGLVPTSTARNCEGSPEEVSREFSGHFVSPKFISRLHIERGEYPAVPICFRYPARTTAGWPEWVSFKVQQEEFEEALVGAGVKISLFISGFCEVYKDDICLCHVVRRLRFIQTGGTRLCSANSENKRLLRSSTVMGVVSRLNLPYTEVYSNGVKRVVGHLKGGKGGDDSEVGLPAARIEKGGKSATKDKVRASEDRGESKRKVRHFKPKVAKDHIPLPIVKSAFGVKVILPSNLAGEKGKKRKAASTLRLSGVTKRKAIGDASPAVLRRSSRVANMSFSKRKSSSKGAVYVDLSDAPGDDGKGSPLSDNVSAHEENKSDAYEGKTCDDGSQAESLGGEDDQGNPTVALMEEDSCGDNQGAYAAISMENHEHNVAGARALMKESAANVGPCADNCNKQDVGISGSVKESAADDSLCEDDHNEQGGSFLLTVGGTSFEPHLPETALRDEGVTAAILVSIGVPLCVASACSLAL